MDLTQTDFALPLTALGLIVLTLTAGWGCKSGEDRQQKASSDQQMREETLPEGPCRRAARDFSGGGEPVLVRGSVRLPDFRQKAAADAPNGDAGPRGASFRERPAREASVVVYRSDNGGFEVPEGGQGLDVAQTDADGNWCAALSQEVELGATVLAGARVDAENAAATLRRSVVTRFGNAITVRSEALTRLLAERKTLDGLQAGAYLNLLSMAATAVDLLSPVEWTGEESVGTAVAKVRAAMEGEARFSEKLKTITE